MTSLRVTGTRILASRYRSVSLLPSRSRVYFRAMATVESLNADIASATQRLNDLRQQNAEASLLSEAKNTLGELKRSLAALSGGGSSKEAGKKKERMLLKVAKVCIPGQLIVPHILMHLRFRVLETMAQQRCTAELISNAP
jgi:hypothetical protein